MRRWLRLCVAVAALALGATTGASAEPVTIEFVLHVAYEPATNPNLPADLRAWPVHVGDAVPGSITYDRTQFTKTVYPGDSVDLRGPATLSLVLPFAFPTTNGRIVYEPDPPYLLVAGSASGASDTLVQWGFSGYSGAALTRDSLPPAATFSRFRNASLAVGWGQDANGDEMLDVFGGRLQVSNVSRTPELPTVWLLASALVVALVSAAVRSA
jgi:hypothetical protein